MNNVGESFSSQNITWRDVCSHKKPASPTWTHYVTRNMALPIVYVCAKLHVTPNMVTTASLLTAIAAIIVIAINHSNFFNIIAFGVLLQLSYALDSADGTLARVTGNSSKFGAWYDLVIDRFSHIAIIGTVMIIMWPSLNTGDNYISYYAVFVLFLASSLTVSNAINLKGFILGDAGKAERAKATKRKISLPIIGGSLCDYGLMLFVIFLAVLFRSRLIYIIGTFTAMYLVALLGMIMKNRNNFFS